jgi:transglutaminase-like putative cysteine protease
MLTQQIFGGDIGTLQTVAKMKQLVNASLVDPIVIQTARHIAVQFYPRDRDSQARGIRDYLQEHFQFVNDPRGVELLVGPRAMVDTIRQRYVVTGDCDEAAILGAALGKAIGLQTRFVLLGFAGRAGSYSHVYTILRGGSRWFSLDITKPLRGPFPQVMRQTTVEV